MLDLIKKNQYIIICLIPNQISLFPDKNKCNNKPNKNLHSVYNLKQMKTVLNTMGTYFVSILCF